LGGPAEFLGALQADHAEWLRVPGPGLWSLPTFIALSLPWFFFTLSNPQVSQRLFILRDFRAMRRMILWVMGFGFIFTLVAVIWGLAALQLAPDIPNTSMATPALLSSGVIPTWVVLFLIVGILSAAISTLDSIALTVGAMIARDVVPSMESHSDARQIFSGRLVIVAVVLFASYFALEQAAIVDQLAALSAAGLMVSVPPIVGAFFWRRGTAAGALAAIGGGGAVAVWLAIFQGISVFNPVLPFAVGGMSAALFIAVSLFTKPRSNALDFQSEIADQLTHHRAW
jgi:SSS family solute:Na+ symporter